MGGEVILPTQPDEPRKTYHSCGTCRYFQPMSAGGGAFGSTVGTCALVSGQETSAELGCDSWERS